MKTIRLEEPERLRFFSSDAETDGAFAAPRVLAPDEAMVRVHRVGVCGTDIHAFNGRQPFFSYPRILGHELGVEVIAIGGAVSNVQVGDKCAVEPYLNCEKCIACRRGKPNCCVDLQVLGVHVDGGMRERFALPARKLHVSKKLSFEQLALVETLGIGAHAVGRAGIEAGEFVLICGAGPIGLSAMQFAQEAGARVLALDINAARLDFCREQIGVEDTINAAQENVLEKLNDITGGDLPTAVFDATGNPQSMTAAFDLVAHGGRLIFIGLFPGDVTFHDPNFHRRELTLLSSRNALPQDFARIIALIENGRIDTAPWITHRAAFGDAADRFPEWIKPESGVIKAMIEL